MSMLREGQVSGRAVAKIVVVAVLVLAAAALAGWLIVHVRDTIRWVFISICLAIALDPAVEALSGRRNLLQGRRVPRWLAIVVVYLIFVAIVLFILVFVAVPIVEEIGRFATHAPTYLADIERYIRDTPWLGKLNNNYHIIDTLQRQAANLPSAMEGAASGLADVVGRVLRNLASALVIAFLTFFLLLDGKRYAKKMVARVEPAKQFRINGTVGKIQEIVKDYLFVNLSLAVAAGAVTAGVLAALGVPFALAIGVLMVFFDLIPLVGLTIGGAVGAVAAATVDFPTVLIVWVAVFLAYQQLQDRVVQPLLYKRQVNLHPFVTVVAVLLGAALLGILGALVAIPVAASLQVIVREFLEHRRPIDSKPRQQASTEFGPSGEREGSSV